MFDLFGFLDAVKRVGRSSFRARPAQPAEHAEVCIGPIERAVKEKSDIAAFLARVYRNQQC